MVSQLGEEIKTQNVQQNTEVAYFCGRNRASVFGYLGSSALGHLFDFLGDSNVFGIRTVSNWVINRSWFVE